MTNPLQTGVDHAELRRLAEAATGGEWSTFISGRPEHKNVTHYIERNPPSDHPFIAEVQSEPDALYISAANPAVMVALLNEIDALRAENDVLEVERLGLRAAIFGSHDYDASLRHANFIEMARTTEEARKGALLRAETAEAAPRAAPVLPDRGWRAIESAPRDERVLIFRPSDFLEDSIFTAFLDEDDWWSVHDGKHDHHLRGNQPTHWMPLPDAPAEGAE